MQRKRNAAVARAFAPEWRCLRNSDERSQSTGTVCEDRERAAGVVDVLVADDHAVEAADAGRAQERRDDAAAGVGVVSVKRGPVS